MLKGASMLLTITTTHRPATDLGYLLHKRPDRLQTFPLSFGQAHVFYPEASAERCTAALLLDVDPSAWCAAAAAQAGTAACWSSTSTTAPMSPRPS